MAKKKAAKKSSKKGIAIAAAALVAVGALAPSEKEETPETPVVSEIVIQEESVEQDKHESLTNKQEPKKPSVQSSATIYVGSDESDKYHKPNCRWAKEINEENLINFESIDEAKTAGYSSCGTCRPK